MKKLLLATTALVALAAPAMAADLPVKAPPVVVAAVYNWSGCYVGGHGGGGWVRHSQRRVESAPGVPAPADYGRADGSGIVAGGQVGCDIQFNRWVIGAQFMGSWTSINTSHQLTDFPTFRMDVDIRSILSLTGRVGVAVQDSALLYLKGGGAWKRDRIDVFQPTGAPSESANVTFNGWTIGGGLEYRLGQYVSVFVEGNHYDFGTERFRYTTAPGAVGGPETADHRQRVTTVIGGLNFRWNWAGPVVARY